MFCCAICAVVKVVNGSVTQNRCGTGRPGAVGIEDVLRAKPARRRIVGSV